jgi:hypothetical protein
MPDRRLGGRNRVLSPGPSGPSMHFPCGGCELARPRALANEASGRRGRASPIARAGTVATKPGPRCPHPAVPPSCHSEHDASSAPRSTTDPPGHLTWVPFNSGHEATPPPDEGCAPPAVRRADPHPAWTHAASDICWPRADHRNRARQPDDAGAKVTVIVRWIPLVTAAYGTWVARPLRTTMLARGDDGSSLIVGEGRPRWPLPRWQAAGAARQVGRASVAAERPPQPPDGGRRGLGPPSPAGRYRPANRDQRPGQPAAACPGDRTANLLDTVATREFLSASAGGAYGGRADSWPIGEESAQSPHDLVGL